LRLEVLIDQSIWTDQSRPPARGWLRESTPPSAWRLLRDRFVAIRRRLSGGVEGFGHYVDGRVQSEVTEIPSSGAEAILLSTPLER